MRTDERADSLRLRIAYLINRTLGKKRQPSNICLPKHIWREVDNKIVACLKYEKIFHSGLFVSDVCVDPQYRRQGLAESMIREAIAAKPLPVALCTIIVGNTPSEKLFTSLGFSPALEYVSSKGRRLKLWQKVH